MTLPVPGDAPRGVAPTDNSTLEALLRKFAAQLSEDQRKTLYSAIISEGGLTVQNGGYIRSLLDNGVEPFYVGRLHYGSPPVDYDGIIMRRPDGTALFYTFPVDGDVSRIAWKWLDHFSNEIMSSDAGTGGLARPWIPMPTANVVASSLPMTASASFTTMQTTGYCRKQQPFARCRALLRSDAAGTGTARFTVNGSAAGSTMSITSGYFGWTSDQTLALPGDVHVDDVRVELEVLRTGGVGSVGGILTVSQRQTP